MRFRMILLRPGSFEPASLNDFLPFLQGLANFPGKLLDYFTLLVGLLIWRRALNRTWAIILLFCLLRALKPAGIVTAMIMWWCRRRRVGLCWWRMMAKKKRRSVPAGRTSEARVSNTT